MKKLLLTTMLLLLTASGANALTILDFDDVTNNHWFFDGGSNIGSYYDHVSFGDNATILENDNYGYYGHSFITHSGNSVLYSGGSIGIQADFDINANHVEFYYSSFNRMDIWAYDSDWNFIKHAGGNQMGDMNGFIELNTDGFDIAHVRIASPNSGEFIIDDFGYEPFDDEPMDDPIPEPSTLLLLASGILGIAGISRLRKK
ncbi:MAG: PEP-CTERM sorting domain-containing protein [candidate division Zixibacteria bacterium]|nr:PEP-CTERM sorting domain-containing protein [candidate division Zixibacteria bacterium]